MHSCERLAGWRPRCRLCQNWGPRIAHAKDDMVLRNRNKSFPPVPSAVSVHAGGQRPSFGAMHSCPSSALGTQFGHVDWGWNSVSDEWIEKGPVAATQTKRRGQTCGCVCVLFWAEQERSNRAAHEGAESIGHPLKKHMAGVTPLRTCIRKTKQRARSKLMRSRGRAPMTAPYGRPGQASWPCERGLRSTSATRANNKGASASESIGRVRGGENL